ncbi:uncharacterized protein LOC110837150 isoform X2 [Zootermopsis nevadensis]|uniref:Uncharacterized protein n=1 Tax=Zootermopsis nevadensis TaxID=136037 RepID=A0A067RRZ1_ZOONE|nr:uncharacterized protein LOC110837150 isoform X2 [Zootermopsis nevadensis]KDR23465.1 hypothetical protein L798_08667 [Zootermopsis nevadensis]
MLYEHGNIGSTSVEMSLAVSPLRKLLFIITALDTVILTSSTRQQSDLEPVLHRQRRDLLFPAMVFPSGTVFQINFAVQTPVLVPNKTLAISLGIQFNFVLPTNATEFRQKNVTRPKRDIGEALLSMYLPFEALLQEYGFDGRTCLLRSICETARSPFNHEDKGLLEEIAHAVLTPSSEPSIAGLYCDGNYSSLKYQSEEVPYLAAECFGMSGGNCRIRYADCPESPLDFISRIINDETILSEEQ